MYDLLPGYEPRSGAEHKLRAQEYNDIHDPEERKKFFDTHSARYFELSRLSYFDPVRMMVFDPMHNVLLGMCIRCNSDVSCRFEYVH